MMALFTPVLRANFTMLETYVYQDAAPFDYPITAFGGKSDRTTSEPALRSWSEQTGQSFHYHMFEGDHFFIQQHEQAVLNIIARDLEQFLT